MSKKKTYIKPSPDKLLKEYGAICEEIDVVSGVKSKCFHSQNDFGKHFKDEKVIDILNIEFIHKSVLEDYKKELKIKLKVLIDNIDKRINKSIYEGYIVEKDVGKYLIFSDLLDELGE